MEIIHFDINNTPEISEPIKLCLGFFDGVHKGHLKLLKKAKKFDGKLGVLSFESRPRFNYTNRVITTTKTKSEIFEKLGVDYLLLLKVDQVLMDTPYEEFIEKCLKKLNPTALIMGNDFTFGKDRLGTSKELEEHFKCRVVSLKKVHGMKVSSSDIKSMIEQGKIETANDLLGRTYSITNVHRRGFGKGRTLGFCTVNVPIGEENVIPKFGVYVTLNKINGKWIYGLTNVGVHPTLNKLEEPIIESHLLNYDKYEEITEPIEVRFIKFIRDEIHFKTIDELQTQVLSDIEEAKKYLRLK